MQPTSTKLTLAKFENAFKRQRVVCDSSSDSSSLGEDEQISTNKNAKSVPAPIPTQSQMIRSAQAEYIATQKYLSQQIKANLEVIKQGISEVNHHINFTCRGVDPLMQARDDLTSNMIAKEINKDNAKVESLQVQQRLLTEATGFETFSKLVKTHLGKRYLNSPTKEFHCTICLKPFTHKWKLDYHDKEVH